MRKPRGNNPHEPQPSIDILVENPDGASVHVQADIDSPGRVRISKRYDSNSKEIDKPVLSADQIRHNIGADPAGSNSALSTKKNKNFLHSIPVNLTEPANRSINALPQIPAGTEKLLFAFAISIYLFVRLIGLTNYPVYFTFDEANPTLLASDFLQNGFRNSSGELFPIFFQNIDKFSLGTTVYLQLIPLILVGKSVFAVRATSVLVGLIGAICVGLILRNIFHLRYWWAGILILSLIPAWFHHSRTAYETVTFVSLYASMLYFYLLYQNKNPKYLFPTILFGAMAFYSYAPGQLLVPLTALVLFFSDLRLHYQQRVTVIRGLFLALVTALPYFRFRVNHPTDTSVYLNNLQSYWVADIPFSEKLITFIGRYLFHLSPTYWFTPEYNATPSDALLHLMKGYGHLPLFLSPFIVWGLVLAIRNFRLPPYRTILITLLVAPVSASIVLSPSSVTRALVIVIPVAVLASLGLEKALEMLQLKLRSRKVLTWAISLFIVLAGINTLMLGDVLINGTHWFDNNQIEGVQFGATKVFAAIQEQLKTNPDTQIIISPNWTMMIDLVTRFFLGNNDHVSFHSIYDYSRQKLSLEDNSLFVLTPEEFEYAKENPKFSDIQLLQSIPYSSEKDGFYLVHLKYSPQSDQIIANEIAERRKLITAQITIDGQPVTISYPRSDGMSIDQLFDNNPNTLFKTDEANPGIFELVFNQPRELKSIFIIHGSSSIELIITIYTETGEKLPPISQIFTTNGIQGNRLTLPRPQTASKLIISVRDLTQGEPGKLHIWDIRLE